MSPWPWYAALCCCGCLLAGCARPAPRPKVVLAVSSTAPTTQRAAPTTAVEKTALPPAETLPPPSPIAYTQEHPGVLVGQVLTADGRGVPDAVAWLVQSPAAKVPPGSEVQLIQKEGEFRPRTQAGRVGAQLKLLSADPQASFKATGAADFNVPLTQGKHLLRTLDRAGLIEVRSELKPGQLAYLWVFDHPYFALTDSTGRFRLPPVEPGAYMLVLWHAGREPHRKQWRLALADGWGASIDWRLPE